MTELSLRVTRMVRHGLDKIDTSEERGRSPEMSKHLPSK